jgi:ATP-dependent Zn protease
VLIHKQVRRITVETCQRVHTVLKDRRDELERIAKELVAEESLDRSELDKLLEPSSKEVMA